MIPFSSLQFIDEGPKIEAEPRPEPKVFVRTFVVPPGLPWDQARAAGLETRHGAPLPMSDVLFQVRRLEAWRPASPGRYAAFYVLAREVDGRLDSTLDLDGREFPVTFLAPGEQARWTRRLLAAGVGAALMSALIVSAVGAAVIRRGDAESKLQAVELHAATKLRVAKARQKLVEQAEVLAHQPGRGARARQALADVAWASSAKLPEAHIQAVHWEPDLMTFEVRGDGAPVAESPDWLLQRAKKPLRRGVWRWGVLRRSGDLAAPQPVASLPNDRSVARP